MGDHEKLRDLIRGFVDTLETELLDGLPDSPHRIDMIWAYDEPKLTLPDAPLFDEIVSFLRSRLHLRTFYVVNSEGSDAAFSSGINFIVGGNILGRGADDRQSIGNLLLAKCEGHANGHDASTRAHVWVSLAAHGIYARFSARDARSSLSPHPSVGTKPP